MISNQQQKKKNQNIPRDAFVCPQFYTTFGDEIMYKIFLQRLPHVVLLLSTDRTVGEDLLSGLAVLLGLLLAGDTVEGCLLLDVQGDAWNLILATNPIVIQFPSTLNSCCPPTREYSLVYGNFNISILPLALWFKPRSKGPLPTQA